MDLVSVNSEHLSAVGYDEETSVLRVEFNDGSLYEYDEVPSDVHAGLMGSGSKGHFFRSHIKGRYRFYRL